MAGGLRTAEKIQDGVVVKYNHNGAFYARIFRNKWVKIPLQDATYSKGALM